MALWDKSSHSSIGSATGTLGSWFRASDRNFRPASWLNTPPGMCVKRLPDRSKYFSFWNVEKSFTGKDWMELSASERKWVFWKQRKAAGSRVFNLFPRSRTSRIRCNGWKGHSSFDRPFLSSPPPTPSPVSPYERVFRPFSSKERVLSWDKFLSLSTQKCRISFLLSRSTCSEVGNTKRTSVIRLLVRFRVCSSKNCSPLKVFKGMDEIWLKLRSRVVWEEGKFCKFSRDVRLLELKLTTKAEDCGCMCGTADSLLLEQSMTVSSHRQFGGQRADCERAQHRLHTIVA